MITRSPCPALAPFVKQLWASDAALPAPGLTFTARRELVLPSDGAHLAIRLSSAPLRVFVHGLAAGEREAIACGHAVIGGQRVSAYVRDISEPSHAVGAMLRPGATLGFFGAPADALAGTHTSLGDVWGLAAEEARERIAEAGSLAAQLNVFESILLARLPARRGVHPAVAEALVRFAQHSEVAAVVRESGYSHRAFNALFRQAVGITPKLYCRVRRFGLALEQVGSRQDASLASVAALTGYSDQAHFSRDFREFSGLSPGRYLALSPRLARHVPLPEHADYAAEGPATSAGQFRSRPVRADWSE